MADEPVAQLGGKTPMQAANTVNMDYLAQNGYCGLVDTIPEGMPPGSDIGNLALLGYDPVKNFTGRAPLEAANLGIMLDVDEVAFRCNLVTVDEGKMVDYSAGHISTEEAKILIEDLERTISWPDVRFYPGKSYRHLIVVKTLNVERLLKVKTVPPHNILNEAVKNHLPAGPQCEILLSLMEKSKNFLQIHQINQVRRDIGENPANMIWLWGQGAAPQLPSFWEQHHLRGAVISAVDLVNGIGRLAGLEVINVPGANGYYDTNYKGKAEFAIESLKKNDFVYVHVEAPDEAGHNGDLKAKMQCIERFDQEVVGTILNHYGKGDKARILVAPDHPTPVAKRCHTRAAVPFVMFGAGINPNGAGEYSEQEASKTGLKFPSGRAMVEHFLKDRGQQA